MTKKEREELKNQIAYCDMMTKKMIKNAKMLFYPFLLFLGLTIWGFVGFHDSFLDVSEKARSIIKWISLVCAIPTGVFSVLFYISYHRSKKMVLRMLDDLEKGKPKLKI